MKTFSVVFDGTSAYVISSADIELEKDFVNGEDGVDVFSIMGSFDNLDEAQDFADIKNDEIKGSLI